MSRDWSKFDEKGLARFVVPGYRRWVPLDLNRADLLAQPRGRRLLIEAIYQRLRVSNIRYAPEQYQPELEKQTIRSATDILDSPGEGTCLDLATLFAGVCLGYELLPVVVVTEVHAFCLVSLTHGSPEWDDLMRSDRDLFENLVTDGSALAALVDSGAFLAVECTGFAHSESLPPESIEGTAREDGYLPFATAVEAGRQQLDRADSPLRFAFDAAVAHHHWKITPPTVSPEARIATEELVAREVAAGLRLERVRRGDVVRPYPRPVAPAIRPLSVFVDRKTEVGQAIAASVSGTAWISGATGIGKTAILRHVAHDRPDAHFADGIVYLSGALNARDVAQELYETLYETDPSFQPSRSRIAASIKDLDLLLMVDGTDPSVAESLADLAPRAAIMVAQQGPGPGTPIVLGGLPPQDGVHLFTSHLGRPLNADEEEEVRVLCQSVDGHPAQIVDAARLLASGATDLKQLVSESALSPSAPSTRSYAALSGDEQLVVDLLQAFGEHGVSRGHLEAMIGGDVAPALSRLVTEDVIRSSSPRYKFDATWMGNVVSQTRVGEARARAVDYFEEFVSGASLEELSASLPELVAVMGWANEQRRWDTVVALGRAAERAAALSRRWGVWWSILETMRKAAIQAGDRGSEALALHEMGTRARLLGDKKRARSYLKEARKIRRAIGDGEGESLTKHNLRFARSMFLPWFIGAIVALGGGIAVTCATTDFCGGGEIVEPGQVAVTVEPGELAFAELPAGSGGLTETVRLSNEGERDAVVSPPVIDGSSAFTVSGSDCSGVLAAQSMCDIAVTFAPSQPGPVTATLVVDVEELGALTIPLTGTALEPADVTIAPAVGDFGQVSVGETAEVDFTLSNEGGDRSALTPSRVQGEAFSLSATDCGEALGPGEQCTVTVVFTPQRDEDEALVDRLEEGLLIAESEASGEIQVPLLGVSTFLLPDLTAELASVTPVGRVGFGESDVVVFRVEAVVRNGGNAGAGEFAVTAETFDGDWRFADFAIGSDVEGSENLVGGLEAGAESSISGFIRIPRGFLDPAASLPVRLIVDSCAGREFVEDHCEVLESSEDNNATNEIEGNEVVGELEVPLERLRDQDDVVVAVSRETNLANLVVDALHFHGLQRAENEGLEAPHAFLDATTLVPPSDDDRARIEPGELRTIDLVDIAPGGVPLFVPAMPDGEIAAIFEQATAGWGTGAFPHVARGSTMLWCSTGDPFLRDLILDDDPVVADGQVVSDETSNVMTTASMLGDVGDWGEMPSMAEILRHYITDALGGTVTEADYPLDGEGRIEDDCRVL